MPKWRLGTQEPGCWYHWPKPRLVEHPISLQLYLTHNPATNAARRNPAPAQAPFPLKLIRSSVEKIPITHKNYNFIDKNYSYMYRERREGKALKTASYKRMCPRAEKGKITSTELIKLHFNPSYLVCLKKHSLLKISQHISFYLSYNRPIRVITSRVHLCE